MDPQTIYLPAKRRVRRKRKQDATSSSPVPPAALVLVAATFTAGDPSSLTLTFDRAIDIDALDGSVVLVRDGAQTEILWDATGGAVLTGPATMEITLTPVEGDSAPGTVLTAGPGNGIVAVDDGGTWGGVSELALPFP
ncbi:MAG: hypothetical protein M3478_09155 [Planctomycetota bacterium]|nr:hypothetical protein [Planctomycetota bacterium]